MIFLKEYFGVREEAFQKEIKVLYMVIEKFFKENEFLRSKFDYVNKENFDVIVLWKFKLEIVIVFYQQVMEELKVFFSKGIGTDFVEFVELKIQIERLRLDYQYEIESLQSKQDFERFVYVKEMEIMQVKLMKIIKEKEDSLEVVKARLDSVEDQYLVEMEDTLNKLQEAEIKVKELEVLQVKYIE